MFLVFCLFLFYSQMYKNKYDLTAFNQVLNIYCSLDLKLSNPIFSQDTLAFHDIRLSLVMEGSVIQKIRYKQQNNNNNRLHMAPNLIRAQSTYKDIRIHPFHHKQSYLNHLSPHPDCDLTDCKTIFSMAFQFMLMHHHISLVTKGSAIQKMCLNSHSNYEPLLWPRTQESNLSDTLAYDDIPSNLVAKRTSNMPFAMEPWPWLWAKMHCLYYWLSVRMVS